MSTKPSTSDNSRDAELEIFEDDDFALDYPEDYPSYPASQLVNHLSDTKAVAILEKQEDTRGRLAMVYTIATFLMFILGFIVALIDSITREVPIVDGLLQILPLISGIFLGTLGFVLGYYFRRMEGEDKK